MKVGSFEHACPKLEESQRLDPSPGTLLNLAICEEEVGRLATAWAKYRELVDTTSTNDPRRAVAIERLGELEPRLPRLHIENIDTRVARTVLLDGVELRAASLGMDIPVNPGTHVVVLMEGRKRVDEKTVETTRGETSHVAFKRPEVPEALVVTHAPRTASTAGPSIARSTSPPATGSRSNSRGAVLRRGAYVAGALGGVSLAAAGVLTLLSFGERDTVDAYCTGGVCEDERGFQAAARQDQFLRLADAALVTGIIGLATGGILFWQSTRVRVDVSAGPELAALSLRAVLP